MSDLRTGDVANVVVVVVDAQADPEPTRVVVIDRGGATFMALAALRASGRLVDIAVCRDAMPSLDLRRLAKMIEPELRPERTEEPERKPTRAEWRRAMKGGRS